jgi:hypothetical protein
MRQIFTFLTTTFLVSCAQDSEPNSTTQNLVSRDSINKRDTVRTYQKAENKTKKLTTIEWEAHEDSLRNEILKSKDNKVVKESFLQELYIRNVVVVSKDSLLFNIPFNLHGPDCGAPDCYSTDISFSFKFGDTLIFPKTLWFDEHEHGCVDKEKYLTGNFQLVEQTDKHIIYHSTKQKRTLILFSSNKTNGTTAYYFTEVGQNRVNGNNLYRITRDYNEEDKNSIYPFTSWILTTSEYENFLK